MLIGAGVGRRFRAFGIGHANIKVSILQAWPARIKEDGFSISIGSDDLNQIFPPAKEVQYTYVVAVMKGR